MGVLVLWGNCPTDEGSCPILSKRVSKFSHSEVGITLLRILVHKRGPGNTPAPIGFNGISATNCRS